MNISLAQYVASLIRYKVNGILSDHMIPLNALKFLKGKSKGRPGH